MTWTAGDERETVARRVLATVARFAGGGHFDGPDADDDIELLPGENRAIAVERTIRELAREAEGVTLHLGGQQSQVVCGALGECYLLDDYLRIVSVEQHEAFGDDMTAVEREYRHEYLRRKAQDAAEMAEFVRRQRLDDLRICRCGASYFIHRIHGNTGNPQCWRFSDLDDAQMRTVQGAVLEDLLKSWLTRHGIALGGNLFAESLDMLRTLRSSTMPAREALMATGAAVGWPISDGQEAVPAAG